MEGFFDTERGKIFYIVEGKGKPILMIHGFADNSNYMKFLSSKLNGYTRVMIDLPCHGKSADFSFEIDELVKYLESLMENLSLTRFSVLGHSLGALIAEYFTIKSERVDRGIFISPTTRIDDKIIDIISSWVSDPDETFKYAYDEEYLRKNFESVRAFEEENEYDFSRFSYIAETFMNFNIENLYSEKECLSIIAENDKIFGKEYHENMKKIFPECRFEYIHGGHSLITENPDEVSEKIKSFMEK